MDSPTGFKNESGTLSWNEVLDAKEYNIYENTNVTGAANLKIKKVLQVSGNETTISGLSPDKEYLISTTDYTGNETPLVNGSYLGIESYGDINSGTQKNPEKINHAPIPEIVMSPSPLDVVTTSDTITWDYTFTDEDGDTIQNVEWEGKQDSYNTEGAYTVRLRVQDSQGTWSDWVEKMFTVISMSGVKDISAGGSHTLLLMADGTVKSFGYNIYGQLGYATNSGTSTPNPTPITIPNISGVKSISAGAFNSFLLMNDGTVKSFGLNNYGQLGYDINVNTITPNPNPETIPNVNDVKSISVGGYHALLLMEDGTVKSFGRNQYGQLGYISNAGTSNPNSTPTTIPNISGVKAISIGKTHSLLLMEDGTVKSFGVNYYGQLGLDVNTGISNPNSTPTTIPNISGVKAISSGSYHTLLLMEDGTVKSFGINNMGQLGYDTNVGTTLPNPIPTTIPDTSGVKAISSGDGHSLLLNEDETVKSFGLNNRGQLGITINLGTTLSNPTTIPSINGVKSVSTGYNHTLLLMKDGTVKSFGSNQFGQLGNTTNLGSTTFNPNPTEISLK